MKHKLRPLLAGPYLIWILGFTVLPLLVVVWYAFTDRNGRPTPDNLGAIANSVNLHALGLSLILGLITTLICLLLAYPLAMILSRMNIKNQSFVVFLFMLPMWMNFLLRILAWKQLLSKNGVINTMLSAVNLPNFSILNTPAAVVMGMVYDFFPFMLLPLYNAMTRIRKDWIEAAQDLGAGNFIIFTRVIFPLTISGVISGVVMVFVPSLTSFAISQVLGGGRVLLIGNVIEQSFMQSMQWNTGSGLSLILMVFVLASMALMNQFDREGGNTAVW